MSARVIVGCDEKWPGKPCSGRFVITRHVSAAKARELAEAAGWSREGNRDLCPAHTRALVRDRERRGAV